MKIMSTAFKSMMVLCLLIGSIEQGIAACEGSSTTLPLDYTLDMSQSGWVKIGTKQHKYPPTGCTSTENGFIYAYSPEQSLADSPVGLVARDRDTPYLYFKLVRPNGDAYTKHGGHVATDATLDEYVNIEYYIDYSTPNILGGKQSSVSMIGGVYAERGDLNRYLHALLPTVNIRAAACTIDTNNTKPAYNLGSVKTSAFDGAVNEPAGRVRVNVAVFYNCPGHENPPRLKISGELMNTGSPGVLKNILPDGAKGVGFRMWQVEKGVSTPLEFDREYDMTRPIEANDWRTNLAMTVNYWKYDDAMKAGPIRSIITFDISYD